MRFRPRHRVDDSAEEEDDDEAHTRPYRRKALMWLAGGLVAILVVVAVVFLLPEGDKYDVTPAAETEMIRRMAPPARQPRHRLL